MRYEDQYEAFNCVVDSAPYTKQQIANHIWPTLPLNRAEKRLSACLSPLKRDKFSFIEVIRLMRFCNAYDPLYFACDLTEHGRPIREISDEDLALSAIEKVNSEFRKGSL